MFTILYQSLIMSHGLIILSVLSIACVWFQVVSGMKEEKRQLKCFFMTSSKIESSAVVSVLSEHRCTAFMQGERTLVPS